MLKKLSLAALVAMGSMSFASATPLTEAIKNVDFSGYLRLRVYNDSNKNYVNKYRTTALFKFSVPVSEELKFNTAYALDWSIYNDGNTNNEIASGATPTNVKFFLQYNKDNLTAIAGKIPVKTPVTATGVGEATAAGLIATYKVNDNITVAAAGLDAMVGTDLLAVNGNNTYAAAAIYNEDNIKAEAWFFHVANTIKHDVVLRATYTVEGISLHADIAVAKLDDSLSTKTQKYANISGAYKQDQICAKLGFAKTGKDGGTVVLDADAPIASVLPTEQKTGIANTADTSAIYAKAGYQIDTKTNTFLAASLINDNSSNDNDYIEYMIGAKYAYNKKMNIYAYYSILDGKHGAQNNDNKEARVEFKYSF